jgi:hypothetical protein
MNRLIIAIVLLTLAAPAYAKTHKDNFDVPCSTLWKAVKDTIRNSGKYIVVSIDEPDMTASYSIGSILTSKRVNSVSLNPKSNGCEMQTQTSYSGLVNNDAGDFKKRVEDSLAKMKSDTPAPAMTPK